MGAKFNEITLVQNSFTQYVGGTATGTFPRKTYTYTNNTSGVFSMYVKFSKPNGTSARLMYIESIIDKNGKPYKLVKK